LLNTLFQFQYGSIDSEPAYGGWLCDKEFQFQYGSIDSRLAKHKNKPFLVACYCIFY